MLHESGAENADHAVLLLPGARRSAAFYDDLIAEPSLRQASIRFVATTSGFGGTAPLEDVSIENYAERAGVLAADLGCDAVVAHGLGRYLDRHGSSRYPGAGHFTLNQEPAQMADLLLDALGASTTQG